MKRFFLALLILCMTAAALAEEPMYLLDRAPRIASAGDELYVLLIDGLYRYDLTSRELVLVDDRPTSDWEQEGAFDDLLSDGKTLYGVNVNNDTLTRLDTMETIVTADLELGQNPMLTAMTGDAFIIGTEGELGKLLTFCSLADGSQFTVPFHGGLTHVTGYKDGLLLVTACFYRDGKYEWELLTFDPLTDAMTTLGELDGGYVLIYDDGADIIYLLDWGAVYRWEDGLVLDTNIPDGWINDVALLSDGLIAVQVSGSVVVQHLSHAE